MIVSCPSCDSKYQVADDKVAGNVLRTRCKSCGSQILVDGTIPPPRNDDDDEDDVTRIMRPEDRPDAVQSRPPSSAGRWTVQVGKEETQPMTSEDVVNGVLTGSLRDDASIWKSGMSNWATIADIPELVEAVEAARRRARSNNRNSPALAHTSGTNVPRSPVTTPTTRTSKPPPPVRNSVPPGARTNGTAASSLSTQKNVEAKQPQNAQSSTGDLYEKIASKVGAKPSSISPSATGTTSTKPSARPSPTRSLPSNKEPAVVDVQPTLDPTAAPEDFYSKILAKVRPPKQESVPPPANPEPKPLPSARKTLPPPTWGAIGTQTLQAHPPAPAPAAPPAQATRDPAEIEISIDTDDTVGPAAAAPPSSQSATRRSSPTPPFKRQEPAIHVDIQLPPIEAAGENRLANVTLPGSRTSSSAPPPMLAAPKNDIQPSAPPVVVAPSSPPAPLPQSAAQAVPSKPAAEALSDDIDLDVRAFKRRRSRRFGTVAAVLTVGLLGVGGGIAATIYALKSPTKDAKATVSSMPAASAAPTQTSSVPARAAESASVTQATSASSVNSDELAHSGGNQSARGNTSKHAPRGAVSDTPSLPIATNQKAPAGAAPDSNRPSWLDSASATKEKPAAATATKPAPLAASDKPAKSGAAPFNRDAAMAVLGIAASQAPSCKRSGGPTGNGRALVTFDSDGQVIITNVIGEGIAGTPVARCVAALFQRVRVAPFSGDRQTVSKPFSIPP